MNRLSKLTAFALSFSIIFASVGAYSGPRVSAESLSSLKDRQSEIQSKINENEEKLNKLKSEQNSQEKVVSELNAQLSNLSDQYENVQAQKSVVDNDILQTQLKIGKLNKEIEEKEKEIDKTVQLFCKRLRANYISGNTTTLEMLTSSDNISVFLNRIELLKRVTDNDQSLVDELNEEIKKLDESKAELEAEKQVLVTKQAELQTVENELQGTLNSIKAKTAEVEAKLAEINNQVTSVAEDIESFNAQEAEIKAAINKIYAEAARKKQQSQQSSQGSVNSESPQYVTPDTPSSGFMFPVTYGGAYISSGYGYRSASISGWSFHGGIDITGGSIYGQPVYASRAGTVIVAEHYSNVGYGHYVMLDHGDGYQTLYGHCSSVVVNSGQSVQQGQLIAYVGSTGNSTGPHLHFEVRYQGERLNPLNFVSY